MSFDGVTTGASNDIIRATRLAKEYGRKSGVYRKTQPMMYAEEG
jgi:cell division protease FtsH